MAWSLRLLSRSPSPQTAPGEPLDPRTYAPASKPFLAVYAVGVQKYACQPNGTWLFTDPEATLYKTADASKRDRHPLSELRHRASGLEAEGRQLGRGRPEGDGAGGSGNIAWLLLQAVVTTAGSDGDRLEGTTWVQRLNTVGGVAPAGMCTPGDTMAVPYSTDYVFWKATGKGQPAG